MEDNIGITIFRRNEKEQNGSETGKYYGILKLDLLNSPQVKLSEKKMIKFILYRYVTYEKDFNRYTTLRMIRNIWLFRITGISVNASIFSYVNVLGVIHMNLYCPL